MLGIADGHGGCLSRVMVCGAAGSVKLQGLGLLCRFGLVIHAQPCLASPRLTAPHLSLSLPMLQMFRNRVQEIELPRLKALVQFILHRVSFTVTTSASVTTSLKYDNHLTRLSACAQASLPVCRPQSPYHPPCHPPSLPACPASKLSTSTAAALRQHLLHCLPLPNMTGTIIQTAHFSPLAGLI